MLSFLALFFVALLAMSGLFEGLWLAIKALYCVFVFLPMAYVVAYILMPIVSETTFTKFEKLLETMDPFKDEAEA